LAPRPLFRTQDLGGGFRLHLRRTRAFKTVTARLALHADLDEGTPARALVARVLGRGTARFPSLRDLHVELDRLYGATLGGDSRKVGERQVVEFRADWIEDRLAGAPLLAEMGRLLAEYLHEPARDRDGGLRGEIVLQERKMMADEAAAVFDDKGRYARQRLLDRMCAGEAYARPAIGREQEIRALGVEDVRAAHRDLLARSPADLFLVGDLPWSQALRFARGLRLDRRRGGLRLRRTTRRRPGRVRTFVEKQPVGQARLEMGFRTRLLPGSPAYPGLVLMNALFGGTPIGKLFKVVREKASLCYSIGSTVERTKGLVLVNAGIDPAHYGKARRLILRQLDELRRGDVAPEAVAQARGILVSALRSQQDSPGALIDFALDRAVNGEPADLDGIIRALSGARMPDVARAARAIELDTVYLLRS
jgi:predicted Zn-dependent peptidase